MKNTNSKVAELYKKNYTSAHKQTVHDYDISYQIIISHLKKFNTNAKILDAGCGNGRYANKIYNQTFYKRISAIDLFDNSFDNISFQKASVESLPFNDNTFDLVYSISVVYYSDDVTKAINELKRVLKPGGILIITAFNKWSIFSIFRKIKRILQLKSKYSLSNINFLKPKFYLGLFPKHMYKILECNGYFFPLYPQLLNYLSNKCNINNFAPKIMPSSNKLISKLKANFGYHQIIVAKKNEY